MRLANTVLVSFSFYPRLEPLGIYSRFRAKRGQLENEADQCNENEIEADQPNETETEADQHGREGSRRPETLEEGEAEVGIRPS